MLGIAVGVLALLLLAFVTLCAAAYLFQDQLLFHPQPLTPEYRTRMAAWATHLENDGVRLQGWYAPADDPTAPLLVYYGGNAEEVSWNLPALRELGVSVLLFNYRGYGDSTGTPSEAALKGDALTLLDRWLQTTNRRADEVILMGRSLGSGVATYIASLRPVRGVILVTPYDSLVSVGRLHYPWLPVDRLMRNRFESITLAPALAMPLLNLLAQNDRVVPAPLGRRLGAAWRGPVSEISIAGADHISLTSTAEYRQALHRFVRQLR